MKTVRLKMTTLVLFALGTLLGGGAAFALRPAGVAEADDRPDQDRKIFRTERRERVPAVRQADLKQRLDELERKLAETRQHAVSTNEARRAAALKPFDYAALLHDQRVHDPETYAYTTNAIVRHAMQQVLSTAEDLNLLASVDSSNWDPGERAAFEEYVELCEYIAQYEAKLAELRILDPELPPGYGYDQISQEIFRKYEVQCDVRYRLMAEAAKLYGLSEEDAMNLADVAHCVTESTLSYNGLREERERNEARRRRLKEESDSVTEGGAQ